NVFNIGSTEEISIEDLAVKIKEMTGSSSDLKYIPYDEAYGQAFDDMRRRIPCLDRIQSQVGFQPRISLDETLKMVIDYFRKEIIQK
ncbi:MAG: nucleoside-diphosphate sugar epimerase, partial [Planctomycetota bacterium]